MVKKALYGFVFVVVLPVALIVWAQRVEIDLPTPRWPIGGFGLAAAGICLILEAMRELWVHGRGLPMNAFPPTVLVTKGVYGLMPHPIYVGFCAASLGVSVATDSGGGLWLVTPMVVLGCIALVMGYEGPAHRARFAGLSHSPSIRPPERASSAPKWNDRLGVYVLLFVPWLILYEAWGHAQPDWVFSPLLPGESRWPVLEWTTFVYSLAYPFTLSVPLLARTGDELRRFFDAGVVAVFVVLLSYIVLPVHAPPRPFDPQAIGGWLLSLERLDGLEGAVALPAFHAVWAIVTACWYAQRGRGSGVFGWSLCAAICISCVTTGMHAVADIVAAVPFALLAWNWPRVWSLTLGAAERIANSWKCVRIGPVRIISYAAFAGMAAAVGVLLTLSLAGPELGWRVAVVAVVALLCAALWGQVLVGSATLLRPFGYFGALIGTAAGLAWIGVTTGRDMFWIVAGALGVSAPWVVLLGRLRCLVQGCCHGSTTAPDRGIRYRHPQSRVCRIAQLHGVPVHPTPVYSIFSNLVIGLVLARLWVSGAPLSLIAGVYLLLAGLTRFVEEATRGEPQTQVLYGLKVYQWLAIASVIAGGVVTALPSPHSPGGISVDVSSVVWSVVVGAVYACAMGVDLPESSRRFSRLT